MKALFPHSSEAEETAWILIAVLIGLVLAFAYLFEQRISRDLPQLSPPDFSQLRLASGGNQSLGQTSR